MLDFLFDDTFVFILDEYGSIFNGDQAAFLNAKLATLNVTRDGLIMMILSRSETVNVFSLKYRIINL